ncbi:MAG: hypothetical protein HC888_03730 [Candidatus Competibacteraceae bacterium]|nr:hypothetical protein [Candidatus Competibacteraceae bacterium]
MAVRTALAARNATLTAMVSRLANAVIRIYTGTQPATPETAASGTLLAELTGNATFGTVSNGVLTANAITQDASADATGAPGWARIFQSNGTTVEFDVAYTAGEFQLTGLVGGQIVAGGPVSLNELTYTLPM